MARALSLAAGALGRTSPNPSVGAVIVRDGVIIGEGATRPYGQSHAEPVAIGSATEVRTPGSTMYVTLEPCTHHGRTPPCTEAVIASGIRHVHVATLDPNPRVSGRGVARLREAGVTVTVGEGGTEARTIMAGFARWVTNRRPFVVAKFACSLDGRIATATGESQWITGPDARCWAHGVRDRMDAILVGVGTVVADDPSLTTRLDGNTPAFPDPLICGVRPSRLGDRQETNHPLRVILDTTLRTPATARVANGTLPGNTLILGVDDGTPDWASRRTALTRAGTEVVSVPSGQHGRPQPVGVLALLADRGITSVLLEGGHTIHGAYFDAGVVDAVAAVIAPMIIGGQDAPGAIGGTGAVTLDRASRLMMPSVTRLGVDTLVYGTLSEIDWPEDGPDRPIRPATQREGSPDVHGHR
ncbi:MAG: bifunctional diaminohydroxyphosphoribosylaminopyrimidine deaminase/5-amino-6-(5-phosphoribosylamino)uracil reductase RibD [Chloroflexi bacterium]|nr:bifunctional diaminohydroxyphosphoribosylaminopyrimidine deaminase/5-amino-6-(5-phosphoribosylamino)uracil reductase RibD [Chloroflexota bacterium]